ncbi:hypothetical protein AVEN_99771-1 [Araneus ventricosus]|uniref:Uncharacterized protein n=1 Tax=Araneus ventricosus TaxID=182803 RepID=A0A4Y2BV70_ARAVE|nr:hypothetical protein AVEN_99771-1 [Araneus ventricosus]
MTKGKNNMSIAPNTNDNYFKSVKSTNELVLRIDQRLNEAINIIVQHMDAAAKIPLSNPFHIQGYIKQHVNRHDNNILNIKFRRQDKMIFSAADSVCAAQLLNLEKIMDTPITTGVMWEEILSRFLIF